MLRRVSNLVQELTRTLRAIFLVLWITRVSLTSVVGALVLFLTIPQIRDLLVDHSALDDPQHYGFWTVFWLFVWIFWLAPLYAASRYALLTAMRALTPTGDNAAVMPFLTRRFLQILVVLALLSLVIGLYIAKERLPGPANKPIISIAVMHLHILLISAFACLALVVLACPTWRAANQLQPWRWIGPYVPSAIGPLLKYASRAQRSARAVASAFREMEDKFLRRFLLFMSGIFFLLLLIGPALASVFFARALLIPVILGFWLAPFTLLGIASHRARLPLIFLTLVLFVVIDMFFDDAHLLRTGYVSASLAPTRSTDRPKNAEAPSCARNWSSKESADGCNRVSMQEAFSYWRAANACDVGRSGGKCPKPIVVTAAGGASRAAFFTASVLATLKDITRSEPSEFRDFNTQLFAISSVSGSSLGVAYFLALGEFLGRTQPRLIA